MNSVCKAVSTRMASATPVSASATPHTSHLDVGRCRSGSVDDVLAERLDHEHREEGDRQHLPAGSAADRDQPRCRGERQDEGRLGARRHPHQLGDRRDGLAESLQRGDVADLARQGPGMGGDDRRERDDRHPGGAADDPDPSVHPSMVPEGTPEPGADAGAGPRPSVLLSVRQTRCCETLSGTGWVRWGVGR